LPKARRDFSQYEHPGGHSTLRAPGCEPNRRRSLAHGPRCDLKPGGRSALRIEAGIKKPIGSTCGRLHGLEGPLQFGKHRSDSRAFFKNLRSDFGSRMKGESFCKLRGHQMDRQTGSKGRNRFVPGVLSRIIAGAFGFRTSMNT